MKVTPINDYKDIHQDKETVLVLGYFDALHRGHKVLFDKARQIADEKQLEEVVKKVTKELKNQGWKEEIVE